MLDESATTKLNETLDEIGVAPEGLARFGICGDSKIAPFQQDSSPHAINMGGRKKLGDEAAWLIANKQLQDAHRHLRSCDLDWLPKIKESVDAVTSPSQVAVISRGSDVLARAVAIEVCRDKALQGKFDTVFRIYNTASVEEATKAIANPQGSLLLWFDLKETDCGVDEVVETLGMEWEEEDRQKLKEELRQQKLELSDVLALTPNELKDELNVTGLKNRKSWVVALESAKCEHLKFLAELKLFGKLLQGAVKSGNIRLLLSTDSCGKSIKQIQSLCENTFNLEFTCNGDLTETAGENACENHLKQCDGTAELTCATCQRCFCKSCASEVHTMPEGVMETSHQHFELRLMQSEPESPSKLLRGNSFSAEGLGSATEGGSGRGAGGNTSVIGNTSVTAAHMMEVFSEELNEKRPISGLFKDDDGSVNVRMCFSDVQFLHKLRERVFVKGLPRINNDLGLQVDLSHFVEVYEQTTFGFDRLTSYQQEKMEECTAELQQGVSVLVHAAAGTGKTFIGIHLLLKRLKEAPQSHALFVTPNMTLALFVLRWIGKRISSKDEREQILSRLHVSYSGSGAGSVPHWRTVSATVSAAVAFSNAGEHGSEQPSDIEWYREVVKRKTMPLRGPFKVYIEDGDSGSFIRLADLTPTDTAAGIKYDLTVVDEAHHVFRSDENADAVERWTAGGQLLLLSDISQSSAEDLPSKLVKGARNVELTKVVRSSKRIIAAAMAFQTTKNSHATCGFCDIAGPPLKPFLFKLNQGEDSLSANVTHSVSALRHITGEFPSLNLHNRVVLLVPNEGFRVRFTNEMQERVGAEEDLKSRNIRFVRAHEAAAIADFDKRLNASHKETLIVIDEVCEFDGLERLFVIAVNLDSQITDAAAPESRSQLYRAITRAHMMVLVVNMAIENGWLSFLCHVRFDENEFSQEAAVRQCNSAATSSALEESKKLESKKQNKATANEPTQKANGRAKTNKDVESTAAMEEPEVKNTSSVAIGARRREEPEAKDTNVAQTIWDVSDLTISSEVPTFMPLVIDKVSLLPLTCIADVGSAIALACVLEHTTNSVYACPP